MTITATKDFFAARFRGLALEDPCGQQASKLMAMHNRFAFSTGPQGFSRAIVELAAGEPFNAKDFRIHTPSTTIPECDWDECWFLPWAWKHELALAMDADASTMHDEALDTGEFVEPLTDGWSHAQYVAVKAIMRDLAELDANS